jgi:hypothetical protein
MLLNEGLDDEWVLNSHADTELLSVGSRSSFNTVNRGANPSDGPVPMDPVHWILDNAFRQNTCQHCQVGLSFQFVNNPHEAELTAATCTCSRSAANLRQSQGPQGPSGGKDAHKFSTKTVSSTQTVAPMKPIVPLGSLNKMNESLQSPYLVFMEREYFGDFTAAGTLMWVLYFKCE